MKKDSTQETSEETTNTEKSFEDLLAEKTNGKYKTYDDIEQALSSKETSSKFATEQVEKLNDYVNKGGNVSEYLRTQTADYDEMDELGIVKAHIRFKNQDLESGDVDLLFNSKYKFDEDVYTNDEIRLSKIQLKQDSREAKSELKKFQIQHSAPASHRKAEDNKAELQENAKRWSGIIDESLKDFKNVSFDINDKGEKFSYDLSNDAVEKVRTSSKNLGDYWNKYVNKDGSENISKLNKDMAALDNLDSIVRSAFAQGLAKGKGDVIDDIKNPSYTQESKGDSERPLSMQEQIAAELRGNM